MKPKRFLKLLFVLIMVILITGTINFVIADDISRAKWTTRILSVHESNQYAVEGARSILIQEHFEKCETLDAIPEKEKDWIEKNLISSFNTHGKEREQFDINKRYAAEGMPWNSSCMPSLDLPMYKFEYLLYSDSAMIICSIAGGFATSPCFEFYSKTANRELQDVAFMQSQSIHLFDLTLQWRFGTQILNFALEESNGGEQLLSK